MIGRQVIETNRAFTLEELKQFMEENWDTERYNTFFVGKPTPASIENYIILPATERFVVAAYARKAGSFFSKKNKVILIVCDSPVGVGDRLKSSFHTSNIFHNIGATSVTMSIEKERKGPAEETLQGYSEYMRMLLCEAGYANK